MIYEIRRGLCDHTPEGGIEAFLSEPETVMTFHDGCEAMDWIDDQDFVEVVRGAEVWKDAEGLTIWVEEIEPEEDEWFEDDAG